MDIEEEKRKPRKKKIETLDSGEELSVIHSPIVENKKKYKVILVKPSIVYFQVEDGSNSFTDNIWGMKLKVGDFISL